MVLRPPTRGLTALRAANRDRVLSELKQRDVMSRADLARATGLSATTVSSVVGELLATGTVAETDRYSRGSGSGRRGRLIRLAAAPELVAGIVLGHDRLRVAVSDMAGELLGVDATPLDVDGGGIDALDRATDAMRAVIDRIGVRRSRIAQLVLGIPGLVDPRSGTVVSGRMSSWFGIHIADEVERRLGWRPVVENVADLNVLAEWTFGGAKGLQDVIFVRVSAGIGAGLILGGSLYRAHKGGAGELGHIQLREDGELCSCGNRGCIETIASVTVALAALRRVRPHVATASDLTDLVADGDQAAIRVVTDMGRAIGRAVADLCNVLAPQAVIIGGDLPGPPAQLTDAVSSAIARYTQPIVAREVNVIPTALGENAAVLGTVAASLAHRANVVLA